MISNIIIMAAQFALLVATMVQIVERPGDGADKRAEVIARVLETVAASLLPGWAKLIFGNPAIIGIAIDALVFVLNKTGWFGKDDPAAVPTPSPT